MIYLQRGILILLLKSWILNTSSYSTSGLEPFMFRTRTVRLVWPSPTTVLLPVRSVHCQPEVLSDCLGTAVVFSEILMNSPSHLPLTSWRFSSRWRKLTKKRDRTVFFLCGFFLFYFSTVAPVHLCPVCAMKKSDTSVLACPQKWPNTLRNFSRASYSDTATFRRLCWQHCLLLLLPVISAHYYIFFLVVRMALL